MGQTKLSVVFTVFFTYFSPTPTILRLEDTYGAKIRPPLHVSHNNSVIRPSFKNMRDNFLTKWPMMPKVCLYLESDL